MMGAAYQAKHGLLRNESNFDEITRCLPEPTLVCRPYNDAETVSNMYNYYFSLHFTKYYVFKKQFFYIFRYTNQWLYVTERS